MDNTLEEIIIQKNDAGQRLDKFLIKYFPLAGNSFLYKMLRKKNITRNKCRADGSEHLQEGDRIQVFFSAETFAKFQGNTAKRELHTRKTENYSLAYRHLKGIEVLYETPDCIFLKKPVSVLSQTAKEDDLSINEWLIGYLAAQHFPLDFNRFKPSACNRLDRNTEGIIMCAKTYRGSRYLSDIIQKHTVRKYYYAVLEGSIDAASDRGFKDCIGHLTKDEAGNKVRVYLNSAAAAGKKTQEIHTRYRVLSANQQYSLVEVELITGKSHQIRAHFAAMGHPLAGDIKYGGHTVGGIRHQLLCCVRIVLPAEPSDDAELAGKTIENPAPEHYFKLTGASYS